MLAAALQQYNALESQCETELEEALRILITPNYWRQGSQLKSAESLALFQPGLVPYGGTREQAGGHGVLEVSQEQQTCPTLCRAEPALPAALLLVNGWCSSACPGWGTLGAASLLALTQRGCTEQSHITLRPPYPCSAVRKGYLST